MLFKSIRSIGQPCSLLVTVLLTCTIVLAGCSDGLTGLPIEEYPEYEASSDAVSARGGKLNGPRSQKDRGPTKSESTEKVPTETDSTSSGPAPVASVVVSPTSVSLFVGATQQFSAALLDASGNQLSGYTGDEVSWVSSNTMVATVSAAGLVTALAAGSVTIAAGFEELGATAAVTVTAQSGASTWIHPGDDIQKKVNDHSAGTSFLVKAGIHRMQQVTPKSGMSFIGEVGAVMNGAKLLTQWQGAGPWYVTGQSTSMPSNSSSRCQTAYPRCDIPHDLYINSVVQKHVASLSAVASGTWFYDYSAGRIYVGDNPSGQTVEVTHTSSAFTGSGSGVTIRGLTIEKYANRAQNGAVHGNGTTGWAVENNVLQFNHGVGIRVGHRMQVRGNRILHNGQMGIGGIGDDVLVENNEIAGNNTVGYRAGWEAGGSKFVRTNRLVVRGNFVHHNEGPGLWTDIDNVHTLYENNRVEDNTGPGIFHEISYDAVIRNNTVLRNGTGGGHPYGAAGIRISNSENVTVTGNIVQDNDNGIIGMQQVRTEYAGKDYKLRNLKVNGNAVRMTRGFTGVVRDDGDDSVFSSSNAFSKNTYSTNGSKTSWWAWMNGGRSWSSWQSYGQDL